MAMCAGVHRRFCRCDIELDLIVVFGYAAGMEYPGGKSGAGVYQRIISQMPPHEVYVEPFLGGGAVMRRKRPALWNYGIDLDCAVVSRAADLVARGEWVPALAQLGGDGDGRPEYSIVEGDGVAWLQSRKSWSGTVVYCDPPYPMSVRSSQRRMYRYELGDDRHRELLNVLCRLPCYVMVSGYSCEMYDQALASWRVMRYRTMTRGGRMADECLWCNFPEPVELHDYRYLGRGFRERERIRRKQARWVVRLSAMTVLERRSVESALLEVRARERTSQEARG
jgi:DNA adenine methylase